MHSISTPWLNQSDSKFLAILRSLSIFVIVFCHVGGFWIYRPWSELLHVFVPIFFFISGAVSYNSFLKRSSTYSYIIRRIVGLVIPYYGVSILALLTYIIIHRSLPLFSLTDFIKWITITPTGSPFPLTQVWFLKVLMAICIASPFLFFLYRYHYSAIIVFILLSIAASAIQLKYDIRPFFAFFWYGLYLPFVHSLFFCLGFLAFDIKKLRSSTVSSTIIVSLIIGSIFLVKTFNLNPDYSEGHLAPDFYYVAGSLCAIWAFLVLQPYILLVYAAAPRLLTVIIDFFFRHTFAIFLLHSLAIYMTEEVFGFINPEVKSIYYGINKLVIVLILTLSMSPLFTKSSSWLTNKIILLTERPATK